MIIVEVFVGFAFNSIGLIADAIHLVLDIISSSIVFAGVTFSTKPPDANHLYGHAKMETISSLGVVILLFITGSLIVWEAVNRILGDAQVIFSPLLLVTALAIASVNWFLSRYKISMGKKIRSVSLIADGMMSRADVYACLGVFAGLVFVGIGECSGSGLTIFRWGDPIAALFVAGLVFLAGINISKETYNIIMDVSPGVHVMDEIKKIAGSCEGVLQCHDIRARKVGREIFVDIHIVVNKELNIEAAHDIAKKVENNIKKQISGANLVLVHVDPSGYHKEYE
jgi:cation diffusion facilitator family transporter